MAKLTSITYQISYPFGKRWTVRFIADGRGRYKAAAWPAGNNDALFIEFPGTEVPGTEFADAVGLVERARHALNLSRHARGVVQA